MLAGQKTTAQSNIIGAPGSEQPVKTWGREATGSVLQASKFGASGPSVFGGSQKSVFGGGTESAQQQQQQQQPVSDTGTFTSVFAPPTSGFNSTFGSGVLPSSNLVAGQQGTGLSLSVSSGGWGANTVSGSSKAFGTAFGTDPGVGMPSSVQGNEASPSATTATVFQSEGVSASSGNSGATPGSFRTVSTTSSGAFTAFHSTFTPVSTTATSLPPSSIFSKSSGFGSSKEPFGSNTVTSKATSEPASFGPTVDAGNSAAEANVSFGIGSGDKMPPTFPSPLFPVTSFSPSQSNNNPPNKADVMFGKPSLVSTSEAARKSPEEKDFVGRANASSTALVIREIPDALNKNAWLRRFYSRFGQVSKVICNASKKSATVTFNTHVSHELPESSHPLNIVLFWGEGGVILAVPVHP